MAIIRVHDRGDELRIEIWGKLAGESVHEVAKVWRATQLEAMARRFMTDISGMSAYDAAGRNLLREMYHYGMQFAAGTPLSLVFLNEISMPLRRLPTLAFESGADRKEDQIHAVPTTRALAAGG